MNYKIYFIDQKALYERYETVMVKQSIALLFNDFEYCGELERELDELEREMDLCSTM